MNDYQKKIIQQPLIYRRQRLGNLNPLSNDGTPLCVPEALVTGINSDGDGGPMQWGDRIDTLLQPKCRYCADDTGYRRMYKGQPDDDNPLIVCDVCWRRGKSSLKFAIDLAQGIARKKYGDERKDIEEMQKEIDAWMTRVLHDITLSPEEEETLKEQRADEWFKEHIVNATSK